MTNVSGHIINELSRKGIRFKLSGDWINVWCPYHRGSRGKLKLGIHTSGKASNCWVCGEKSRGGWNKFAEEYSLEKLDFSSAEIQHDVLALDIELSKLEKTEQHTHTLPKGVSEWDRSWCRYGNGEDFDKEFLESIPSYEWYDNDSETYRILWPALVNGKLQGWIAGSSEKDTFIKYRNSDQLPSSRIFFPYDHKLNVEAKKIVLTEGPASAFNLLRNGIPALAILGVKNWTTKKISLLVARGYTHILLAFDGDTEGRECADRAYKDLHELFDVKVAEFPDGQDPANCDKRYINMIKRLMKAD